MSDTSYTEYYSQSATDAAVIKERRDTRELKNNIIRFLEGIGQRYVLNEETQDYELKYEEISAPKVNKEGLQSILFQVETLVNSPVVVGNLDEKQYYSIIKKFHQTLFTDLFVNAKKYALSDRDYNTVVMSITNLVQVFLTRPIGDKERQHENGGSRKDVVMPNNQVENKKWGFF